LALGVGAMARGRYGDAAAHLSILDRFKREAGIREPRLCAHAGELVEALIGTGELEDAAGALARFEEDAERSGGRWSRGAARCCSQLNVARTRRSMPPNGRCWSSTVCRPPSSVPERSWSRGRSAV